MKAVVIGDPHFGGSYSIGKIDKVRRLNSRLIDFSNTFDYVVDYMIANDVKHLILTGDIFEYRRPQAAELSLFAEKIQRLEEHDIYTHIVAGNHDIIIDQRTTTVEILQKLKLPKTFVYSDVGSFQCKDDTSGLMNFIFFPYRTRSMLNCSTNKEAVERLSDRLQYELNGISNNGHNILVGHFMLKNTMLGSMALERNADEVVFPPELFKNLDGTILGHIHPHQIIQNDPLIAYVGSMDCKDFGEAEHDKYFLLIDNSSGDIIFQFERLPIRRLFDITIDQTDMADGAQSLVDIKKQLQDFALKNNIVGSIVRLNLFVSEKVIYDLDREAIRLFMKSELKISHCVGIHTQINSKKQLRKASITERNDPIESFGSYLQDILVNEDPNIIQLMREFGTKIIIDRSGK
jgi:exonuclease SbcD